MAYDRNRNRLVLFGGLAAAGASGETWEWDGQDWTQVSETGPPARFLHGMAFDSSKNVVTLFGGQTDSAQAPAQSSIFSDTWEWDGQNWTQQQDTGPSRSSHAMAYDDARQRLVSFGGTDATGAEAGDTWEWDGTTWTQRSVFGPPACSNPSLVFTGSESVLFGGTHSTAPQQQTWTWDGTYWTARQDIGASARTGHAAAFDSVRQRVVLFGGIGETPNPVGDTWEQPSTVPSLASFTLTTLAGIPASGQAGLTSASGQASVQLSCNAPVGGALITIACPLAGNNVTPTQATVPAGQASLQFPFGLLVDLSGVPDNPIGVGITATLQNGNSLRVVGQINRGT